MCSAALAHVRLVHCWATGSLCVAIMLHCGRSLAWPGRCSRSLFHTQRYILVHTATCMHACMHLQQALHAACCRCCEPCSGHGMPCHACSAADSHAVSCQGWCPCPAWPVRFFLNLPVSDPAIYMPDCACSDSFPLLLLHQRP